MSEMKEIGTYEAKRTFSRLLSEVEAGTRFVITRHGKPVAEIIPAAKGRRPARFGCARSPDFHMAEDFDAPSEDFAEYR